VQWGDGAGPPTLWATGGLERDPPLPEAPTRSAAAVLAGNDPPPGPVVVLDAIGDATGVGIAELLAARGREVALVTPDPVVGHELGPGGDLVAAAARLVAAGVRRVVRTVPVRWHDGVLHVRDAATGAPSTLPCAAIVDTARGLPGPVPPDAEPRGGLLVAGRTVLAGDVLAPRTVHDAVLEGRRAAARLAALAVPTALAIPTAFAVPTARGPVP
jgi:2,4-dienoyl-CoA reductase (NADPH2)